MSKTQSIEIPLTMDSFEAADRFIEQWLAQNRFSKAAITETKLLFEALPFNIRYCWREYGFNRERISSKLPILAQTNQDGNCYLIMLTSMIFIFMMGIHVSLLQIIGIAVLVLFLSIGAPNQPGSILIGMLIITFYLQANELIIVAIYAEVFFGALQNAINVVGDIITVAIEEQKSMRSTA